MLSIRLICCCYAIWHHLFQNLLCLFLYYVSILCNITLHSLPKFKIKKSKIKTRNKIKQKIKNKNKRERKLKKTKSIVHNSDTIAILFAFFSKSTIYYTGCAGRL